MLDRDLTELHDEYDRIRARSIRDGIFDPTPEDAEWLRFVLGQLDAEARSEIEKRSK
jgi:hypothetical protein